VKPSEENGLANHNVSDRDGRAIATDPIQARTPTTRLPREIMARECRGILTNTSDDTEVRSVEQALDWGYCTADRPTRFMIST
jgi:hypothetical protein